MSAVPSFTAVSLDRRIQMLRTAMGPLIAAALEDPDVVEVMLNPDRTLWIDRLSSGRAPMGVELSEADGERIIRLVAAHVGAEVHRGQPLLTAELPETGERFEGILPPAAPGPAFALRKRAFGVIPLSRYIEDGMMTAAQAGLLVRAVRERQNILIAGGTSTGKTTLANALLAEIAATGDRVLVLEDTVELQCAARDHVPLRTRQGVVSMTELVRSSTPGKTAAPATAQVAAAGQASALAGFDPLAAGPASTAAQPADPTAVQNRQDQKEAFLKGGSTETRNSGNLKMPSSPYQVMAGTVIAGALVTGIKSDLPGDVIATVTEPVYDTATGKFLLIPQGSRILGKYNSQVSYGQSRVQVVWNRIILPDTSSLTLDNLVGTDPAGYSGLEDGVDYHWSRIVAGAALTTMLGVGAELAAPENRQDGNRIVIAGRDSAQDSINQVGQEMTRRNMNIQPTLTERPGLPVRIIANRDLVLRPYQPMFFQRGAIR